MRGYSWQYDHIASLVYDSLIAGDFISLRLADPDAGRVDDLVLSRYGRTDFYQFKSSRYGGNFTFRNLVSAERRLGGQASSLARDLGDCWKRQQSQESNLYVHLVAERPASVNDHLIDRDHANRPSPDHFSAFLSSVLRPLRMGTIAVGDVDVGWRPALERLREASGVEDEDFGEFLFSLHLDVDAEASIPEQPSQRRSDITDLSIALQRTVSRSASGLAVELNKRGVLELLGWQGRLRLHSDHEFPVNLDTYAPLEGAIEELNRLMDTHDSGFIAIVGPPGSGKSTLLTQAITGRTDRVVRYYAFMPRATPAKTRLTSQGLLHDLVFMLGRTGLQTGEQQIPSTDTGLLREQLADLLDAAGTEFARTGRRTIVVVDGLDHVDRELPDSDNLLSELPRPDGLPEGVLLIAGSRTTGPLHPEVRQQLDERQAVVDLAHHRLSNSSIIEICSRVPVAAHLGEAIHMRVAELCGGHPLSLGYLLNRIRNSDSTTAEEVLEATPAYEGDIAALYRTAWESVEDDFDIEDILSVCSRLRTGFTTEWLRSWAPLPAVRTFQRKFLYLFTYHHDGWHFFHDSFKQFASDHTASGDDTLTVDSADQLAHKRVAEICANSTDGAIAAEELFHRHRAGQYDETLVLANQSAFREQYLQMRSPDLIRADIEAALAIAADRADVTVMVRLLLALFEVVERAAILEEIDLPGSLFDAGLHEEAIVYSNAGPQHVPLAHIYGLTAKLGKIGDPAGRRLFDLVDHHGFEDHDTTIGSTRRNASTEWTEAVVFYRPLSAVIERIHRIAQAAFEDIHTNWEIHRELWSKYELMIQQLIQTFMDGPDQFDAKQLRQLDEHLSSTAQEIQEMIDKVEATDTEGKSQDRLSNVLASVAGLRIQVHLSLLNSVDTDALRQNIIDELQEAIRGIPLFSHTILEVAELLINHGRESAATQFLDHAPYSDPITASDLRDPITGDSALGNRFGYLKVYFRLSNAIDDAIPNTSTAIVSEDEVNRFAARIEDALQTLARISALKSIDQTASIGEAWTSIVPILHIYPRKNSPLYRELGTLAWEKSQIFELLCEVVCECGPELGQRFSEHLASIFDEDSEFLSIPLWLKIADNLNAIGVIAPWYEDALSLWETYLANEEMFSRLSESTHLINRYVKDGRADDAKNLALQLIPMAFCVGYRKDRQFDSWVGWMAEAISESNDAMFLNEATWLARLLVTANPMTEGEPGFASVDLPAAIVPVDPIVAVRTFEYLVRTGAVDHASCLASLTTAFVSRTDIDLKFVEITANITAELIAPTASRAYPNLAKAIIAAGERVGDKAYSAALAESIADRIDCSALQTTRKEWRRGLGLEVLDGERPEVESSSATTSSRDWTGSDYGSLQLSDGTMIARHEVASHIQSVEDICNLRFEESAESTFSWIEEIAHRRLTSDDVSALHGAFDDGTEKSARVIILLAESAEKNGDRDTALELAREVMTNSRGDSWAWLHGGERKRAAAIIVRLGEAEDRTSVCQDLARQVIGSRWLIGSLLRDIEDVAKALDPEFSAATIWPAVRVYLEGIAETLNVPDAEDLNDHGCRWWLLETTADLRIEPEDSSISVALAELAVGHLSHPTWPVRDAAVAIVSRALCAGYKEVEEALSRFVQPESSDEILERAGRCLAAARVQTGYNTPPILQPLEQILANHSSKVLRDLASDQSPRPYRPLPARYQFELPPPDMNPIGSEAAFLAPYELQYGVLADGLNLEPDTLYAIAAQHELQALEMLPKPESVREALSASGMRHSCSPHAAAASRAAFGRILADLTDAQLFSDAPKWVHRLLRTVDIDALVRIPVRRPSFIPVPPEAGMDQTADRWLSEVEDRLDEYVSGSSGEGLLLIAAKCDLTVLDRSHLHEEFRCETAVGASESINNPSFTQRDLMTLKDLVTETDLHLPQEEMPLVVENMEWVFDQRSTHWLAFHPGLAARLNWTPDPAQPGNWDTASGDSAVKTVWWLDGWLGRAPTHSFDTGAEGHAVVLTNEGLADILAEFGGITRHFHLERTPLGERTGAQTARASRSLALTSTLG